MKGNTLPIHSQAEVYLADTETATPLTNDEQGTN